MDQNSFRDQLVFSIGFVIDSNRDLLRRLSLGKRRHHIPSRSMFPNAEDDQAKLQVGELALVS